MTTAPEPVPMFEYGLRGERRWLQRASGAHIELPVGHWYRERPDAGDELMLARCTGTTLDIGCGPGRFTAALTRRSHDTLGVDTSQVAVELTTQRGARALRRDVFGAVPHAGRWEHALLADGNIGIGGDPHALLWRIADMLAPAGTVIAEAEPNNTPLRSELVRTTGSGAPGSWFRWAWLGADVLAEIAQHARMRPAWVATHDNRCFVELVQA